MSKQYSTHSPKRGNGLRMKQYWIKPKWNSGETTVIRVPKALKEQVMKYAVELDNEICTEKTGSK